MTNKFFVVIIFFCYIIAIYGKKKSSSSTASSDNNEKRVKAVAKKLPVSTLTDSNFTSYIIDRPRDYHAFVMFTATNPQYQCSICSRNKQKFIEVSALYNDQYDFLTSDPAQRIAFFVIEVDNARQLFQEMKMDSVPHMYLLPPTSKDSPKMKLTDYEVSSSALMEGLTAILDEIEAITDIKIQAFVDPVPVLMVLGIAAAVMALIITIAQRNMFSVIFFYQNPRIWVVVSAICFAVGVSGSIFCIIRSAQPFGMTRNGLMLFSMGGRDQFLIEGIIVSLWTLGCGAAGYALFLLPAKLKRFPVLQHLSVILCMAVWVVLATHIWEAYRQKTMWYTLKETLPEQVWSWMSASVKKSTTLPKRLYRLSEIWLTTEGYDFEAIQKKIKILVIDYLSRTLFGSN